MPKCHLAHRFIDIVGDQEMRAGFGKGQKTQATGSHATGQQFRVSGPFQGGQGIAQGKLRRCAVPAIGD